MTSRPATDRSATSSFAFRVLVAVLGLVIGGAEVQAQWAMQRQPGWRVRSRYAYPSPAYVSPTVTRPGGWQPPPVVGYSWPASPRIAQSLPAPALDSQYYAHPVPTIDSFNGPGMYSSPTIIAPENYVTPLDVAPLDDPTAMPTWPSIENYETLRVSPDGSSDEATASVRLAISETLLQRVFKKDTSRFGDVNDCILGARVTGQQQTNTQTTLRLVPDNSKASFEIVLAGVTQSETFGATSIAGVVSSTNSRFEMVKPFSFDGQTITTASPGATVWPQQTNKAAVALRGNVPILGRVIGAYAYREAERRRPRSEQITANRVTNDAAGQFNQRVDNALSQLQSDWTNKVVGTVRKYLPTIDTPLARTTSSHAVFSLPSPWANATAETLPEGWESFGDGVSFAVHESAMNAGVDRLSLGGFEIAAGDWDSAVRRFLPGIIESAIPTFGAQTGSLVLDENEPAEVQLLNGQVRVILNARIKTPLGELPAQRITMPWRFSSDDDSIYATPDEPLVEPIGEDTNPMMAAVRPFLKTQLETELLPLKFPRRFTQPIGQGEEAKTATVTFNTLTARNGWMVIGLNIDVAD